MLVTIGGGRCVTMGGKGYLKFLEVKNDCLIRVSLSNNGCLLEYTAKFSY